jgi:hypothetical protein
MYNTYTYKKYLLKQVAKQNYHFYNRIFALEKRAFIKNVNFVDLDTKFKH